MRRATSLPFVALALLLAACAGSVPVPSASRLETDGDEPGASRGSRESAADVRPAGEVTTPDQPRWAVVSVGAVSSAEDGLGATIASVDAAAVDLDARHFPARALDPVLEIGALRFVHYTYPAPGVLRFVVADPAVLERGNVMAVQYGDDASSRVILAPATEPIARDDGEVAP